MGKKKILIINGSMRGMSGNSGSILYKAKSFLTATFDITPEIMTLTDHMPNIKVVYDQLYESDAFLVITGVYWNSWSSVLQKFLEIASVYENSPAFFGKPLACAVSMDSVGGIEIAQRIHGVFAGLGCWSPPCSTLIISRVGQEAIAASKGKKDDPNEDVWRLDDIEIVLRNLVLATDIKNLAWVTWPHVDLKIDDGPWPITGPVDLENPKFL